VGLPGKAGDTPPGGDALISLTLGDTNDVDVLVLGEDVVDGDLLLEEGLGEVDLSGDISSVDLDLADVAFLILKLSFLTWVWAMTRMTEQNFFILLSSLSMSAPSYFLEYLVKAFLLLLNQFL